jgi:hypothetical protein
MHFCSIIRLKPVFSNFANCLLFVLFLSLSACGSDSKGADDLVGPGDNGNGGNTGPISFSQQVAPIFQSSCGGSGCHINGAKNGVNLTTYAQVISSRGAQYGSLVVLPGNASQSPLINKLGSNPLFGIRMPDGKSALSSSQITLIRTWIDEGALNN